MEDKLRIGIIGVGIIGKHHLNRYKEMGGVEIVAICDIDDLEAERVAALHQVKNIYHNFRDMLKRDDIDAVDVCVHNNLHMPMTIAALQAGKHVYCEKPMAGAYCDALTMYRTSLETGRKLSIQLSTLFSSETRAARELIDAGKLGKIYHGRSVGFRRRGRPFVDGYGTYRFVKKEIAAGGALYDMGVYHIACMLYLLGNPKVERILGKTYQEMDMDAGRRESSGYNVEELGLGFATLQGGLTMDIFESWAANLNGMEGSVILGSQGGIRLEPFGYFHSEGDLDFNTNIDLERFEQRLHDLRPTSHAYCSAQEHWVAALKGEVDLLPTAQLALNTMLISEGIYISNRLGREVTAEEVEKMSESSSVVLP
jgi:predicted dehydrogenase